MQAQAFGLSGAQKPEQFFESHYEQYAQHHLKRYHRMKTLMGHAVAGNPEAGMFNGKSQFPPMHRASNFSLPGISHTGIPENS